MENSLHLKYRPDCFDDVVGHKEVVASLKRVLKDERGRAFIFTGPSGVGKTTLARIVAKLVGCHKQDLTEIDAATYNGIDAMRAVTSTLAYKPLHGEKARVVILDEAHALSKAAWQSLLKSVEEPPPHVWWCFCSTEPGKIPTTIQTRCAVFKLGPVDRDDIYELLCRVSELEEFDTSDDVLYFLAGHAGGSPRRALVYLAQAGACSSVKRAAAVLQEIDTSEENVAVQLARGLVSNKLTWAKAAALLKGAAVKPESIRIVVVAYLTKVTLNAKSERTAGRALELLDAFSLPCLDTDGMAPLLLAVGRALFQA